MTIIRKTVAGILIVFLLSACTRDRPEPDVVPVPNTQVDAATGGDTSDGAGGAVSATDGNGSETILQPSTNGNQTTQTQPVQPAAEQSAVEEPTQIVVVQPVEQQTAPSDNPATNETFQYTVKSGDTLFSIAENYGVGADRIRDLNYLQGDAIQANQVLRIPLLEGYTPEGRPTATPEPLIHVVQAGETLYGIAVQYGLDPTSIIAANNIANQDGIFIGQGLRIPGYAASPTAGVTQIQPTQQVIVIDNSNSIGSPIQSTSGTPVPPNTVQVVHVVQSGEGLFAIAANYGVDADAIAAANNIQNFELISIGQRLVIPGVSAEAPPVLANQQVHVVQTGEGLIAIAVRYGVSAESIAAANNIRDFDLIYPGQQLVIPQQ